jgi:bifunctional DNA-binding transcriptional regulator/antitoxin component of YhaV-PrlF toxin-antitoxin module
MQDTFKTKVLLQGKITIPSKTRKFLGLEHGDWVEGTITLIKKNEKGKGK